MRVLHKIMGNKVIKRICVMLTVVITVSFVGTAYATTKEDAQNKIDKLENNKAELQAYIKSLESLKSNSEAYVRELDEKMAGYAEELSNLQDNQAEVEQEIADTEVELAEAEEDIAEQYSAMKLRIKNMYENGDKQFIELLLESKSITDFLNQAEYISQISQYDRNMLVKMQETKALIENAKATLEAKQTELEGLVADVEAKQEEVQILMDAKAQEIAEYQASIKNAEGDIDEMNSQIAAEEEIIRQIEEIERKRKEEEERRKKQEEESRKAAAAAQNNNNNTGSSNNNSSVTEKPVVSSKGFIWPLPGHHNITSAYGYRTHPVTGQKYKMHQGVDIGASTGTPIVSVASGQVAWANYSSSAGNWIGIDHGNGVYSVYMHCSKILVSVGQKVSQGDRIALVGATGQVTGPHLHFAMRVNGVYVNPHTYVGY